MRSNKLLDGRYRATVGTLFEHQEICRTGEGLLRHANTMASCRSFDDVVRAIRACGRSVETTGQPQAIRASPAATAMLSTSDSSQSGRSARSASSRSFMQARIRSGGKREVTRWRVLIEARLREHPEWADNLIANTLGCSHMTVATVRTELEATCQIGQLDRHLGLDGKWRKNKCRTPPPSLLGRAMQV